MYHKVVIRGTALLLALFWALSAHAAEPPPLEENMYSSSTVCAECHKDIYDEWKDSMHSQSLGDPVFRTAYMEAYMEAGEDAKKQCLQCHAPTTSISQDYNVDDAVTGEGVTCHFCHSIKGVHGEKNADFELEVGRNIRSPEKAGTTPYHDHVESPLHKKADLCAGCHEYTANGISIMGTYTEWKNGPYAAKGMPCQNCHMPPREVKGGNGERKIRFSHRLAGGHSITQLKKAVKVDILELKRGKDRISVTVEVENAGSGHSVPTGIPTRKLVLNTVIRTSDNKTQKKTIIYEKVIFDEGGRELTLDSEIMRGVGSQIIKDNRLAPGEKRRENLVFYTNPEVEVSVSVWVEYLYSPHVVQPAEMRMEMNRAERFFSLSGK